MRTESQTSMHLLMAGTLSILSALLSLITLTMSWELWMVPMMILACLVVWWLHIGRVGTEMLYENICTGLLLTEFFFFGVHESSLFDIALVACIVLLLLSLLDRKRLLYIAVALYASQLLYHFLLLHTISNSMRGGDVLRLLMGACGVVGSVIIARYRINRRRREKEKYGSMQEQLATAVRQNADFLSNVSHELRTPVNMVIGISEVTLGEDIAPKIRENILSIKMAGKRLSGQINNILDYTEIVEGTLSAARKPYSITSVMNDIVTMMALQNTGKLELVFDIDPKLPSMLVGDAEKISHVLKILAENAIKFTEEGGINVRIDYRWENYGVNLIIGIHDTGIGMTDAQLEQMYNDFYQADSGSKRFAGGLGLGLPIARGLLNARGGFIHFDSKRRQGLHANIVIPQGVADDQPCITLNHPDQLCIACYFRPEKYINDEVRGYYDGLILNLVEGLNIEGYQAHNFEGFLKLQRSHTLTHVFIAQPEYEENRSYYEELAETIRVIVIADREFVLDSGSRLLVIHKPFSALSVANLLNGEMGERGFAEDQAAGRKPFTCVGVRALAVDDEEMNLVVAQGVLGSYGIEVDTCLSGREAVAQCGSASYDIIFLDHMMPGFDGVETLKKIHELYHEMYQDIPIIALTANTVSGAREMFRSEGFTEFVPKPIERAVLERVLRKVLPKSCIRYTANSDRTKLAETGKTAEAEAAAEAGLPEEPAASAVQSGPVEDTQATDSPAESPLIPYERLRQAGVNTEIGLNYCGGEENFYREMLRIFFAQSEEKRAELVSLYEEENWPDYTVKVHALKSTSLTIGAETLSAQAKELELAGKRGDTDFIRERHAALMDAYDALCAQLVGI